MTKKNLTLGLLVFIVGVMITACGSKDNGGGNSSDNNSDDIPKSWEDNKCENCTKTYNGKFRIVDEDLYLQAYGHISGNDISFGGNSVFNQVLNAVLEPAAGILVCGSQAFLTELAAELMGIDNVDIECTTEDLNLFGGVNNDFDDIRDEYNARIRVRFENGEADTIELVIDSNIDGGDDEELFYYERSNRFVNSEETLLLQNANGRVRLGTTGGRLIGEFRD